MAKKEKLNQTNREMFYNIIREDFNKVQSNNCVSLTNTIIPWDFDNIFQDPYTLAMGVMLKNGRIKTMDDLTDNELYQIYLFLVCETK